MKQRLLKIFIVLMIIHLTYKIFKLGFKEWFFTKGINNILMAIIVFISFFIFQWVWNGISNQSKWKSYKLSMIVGFGGFVLWALIGKYLPKDTQIILIYVWFFLVFVSLIIRFIFKLPDINANSFEEKIKSDLKIVAKTYKKKFPKILNWIGGAVTPSLPFITLINKNWKKRLTKEAVIHENVHIYYFQNGWMIWILLGFFILTYIPFIKENQNVSLYIYIILSMVYFEYITFRKTNQYGEKLGITTRKWNGKIMLKYLMIYLIQMGIVFLIIIFVKWLFGGIR